MQSLNFAGRRLTDINKTHYGILAEVLANPNYLAIPIYAGGMQFIITG
jgi:hypothetical protein